MSKLIKMFVRDERGAAAAEYALILAVIGGGIAVAAGLLGTEIGRVITEAKDAIAGVTIPPPPA